MGSFISQHTVNLNINAYINMIIFYKYTIKIAFLLKHVRENVSSGVAFVLKANFSQTKPINHL